jgi:hypothetical protein
MHWLVAQLAVETGISPVDLLQLQPRMLWTIERYMVHRNQRQKQGKR